MVLCMGLPGIAWLISLARNATDEVQRRHANRSFETNGGNRPSLFFISDHRAQSTCAEGMTGTLVVDLTVTSSVAKISPRVGAPVVAFRAHAAPRQA